MRKQNGFTLIELLVTITIIGVLAAIGLTSYATATQKARNSRRAADIQQLRSALEMYRTDNGEYPDNLSQLNGPPDYIPGPDIQDPRDYNYDYSSPDDYSYTLIYYLEPGETEVVYTNP